jgi:hypothetical protein
VASRASSIESFRSGGVQRAETPEPLDQNVDIDDRRVTKKLSVINAEDEDDLVEDNIKSSIINSSPKSNSSCGGLGFPSNFVFDELSPIREMFEANPLSFHESELIDDSYNESPHIKQVERQRAISSSDEESDRRGLISKRRNHNSLRKESTNLSRAPSEPTPINQLSKLTRRSKPPPMLRR